MKLKRNHIFTVAAAFLAGCSITGTNPVLEPAESLGRNADNPAGPLQESASVQPAANATETKASLIGLVPGETSAKILFRILGRPDAETSPQPGRVLALYKSNRLSIIDGYQKNVPMLVVLATDDPQLAERPERILTLDFRQRPNGWIMTGYKLD